MQSRDTVVAVFEDRDDAQDAINALRDAGFMADDISILARDRDTAGRLGITLATIDNALYDAFGQRIVSTIFTETNQYRVILEAARDDAVSLQSVVNLPLKTSSGVTTPLSSIAKVREQSSPLAVMRVAQYPAATVGFDTASGVSLGVAVDEIRAAATEMGLPESITLRFTGASGAYKRSLSNQLWLILAAVVCVYIVLGVLYESYVHPLTILSTLPSAGVGALLATAGKDWRLVLWKPGPGSRKRRCEHRTNPLRSACDDNDASRDA